MSLERFCRKEIATVRVDDSVVRAAREMREKHVGAVVVVDRVGRPVGMLTDRDVVCRVVGEARDPVTVAVESVMTPELVTVRRDGSIDEVAFAMRKTGVRRIPIVDAERKLVGLVAFDDLVVLLTAELGETVAALRDNKGP